jgi:hypothetical protein
MPVANVVGAALATWFHMAKTPMYRDEKLPVTAEVGSEGGSYADPTFQEATDHGDIDSALQTVPPDHLIPPGSEPAEGMKKPPTE